MFLSTTEAKKDRHSQDTVEQLNQLFPKSCDIMGITTPGIVCKCLCLGHIFSLIWKKITNPPTPPPQLKTSSHVKESRNYVCMKRVF